jgi:hypothetical protein
MTQTDEAAMLYALLALMAPLRDRLAAPREASDTSVARLLLVVAAALSTMLAILLVDLHSDELGALAYGGAPINAVFLSP